MTSPERDGNPLSITCFLPSIWQGYSKKQGQTVKSTEQALARLVCDDRLQRGLCQGNISSCTDEMKLWCFAIRMGFPPQWKLFGKVIRSELSLQMRNRSRSLCWLVKQRAQHIMELRNMAIEEYVRSAPRFRNMAYPDEYKLLRVNYDSCYLEAWHWTSRVHGPTFLQYHDAIFVDKISGNWQLRETARG